MRHNHFMDFFFRICKKELLECDAPNLTLSFHGNETLRPKPE